MLRVGGSTGISLLLTLGLMMGILLIIVVVVILLTRKRKKQREENLKMFTREIEDRKQNVFRAGQELGIEVSDLQEELFDSSNLTCYVYPENGVCDSTFYELKNGCCELKSNASELSEQARKEMALNITTTLLLTVLPEIILTEILPRILKNPRYSLIIGRLRNLGSKTFSKIMAKSIAKTAMKAATAAAAKAAAMIAKLLIKLGAGPVGWALLVFDIFTAVQDLADRNNYGSYLENKMNMETRDIIVYEFAKAMQLEGMDYPALFPFSLAFPTESETAMMEYQSKIVTEYMTTLLEIDGGVDWLAKTMVYMLQLLEAEETGGDPPPPMSQEDDQETSDIMGQFLLKVREEHHLELDEFLFDTLQELLPISRKSELILVPVMSSPATFGISLSEEGARKWNESKRAEWFEYIDPFFPPNSPSADWTPPMVATYTDTYLTPNTLNPGTSNAPNITTESLPEKMTLMYPFASLVTFCEKERTTADFRTAIDPTDYDVTFDPVPGVCNFTRKYCQRYGLDFETKEWKDGTPYNECELSETQEGLEMVFGTENVRQAKLWLEDPEAAAANQSQQVADTLLRRNEEHGPAVALLLTAVDPTGMWEGFGLSIDQQLKGRDKYCVTGDTCKEITVKHDGGNFMGWSARDSDGQVYSNGQGFQNQVKHGENHTFFVPEGGYFRVKCDPGEGLNIQYGDIPESNTLKFSCWWGKVDQNPNDQSFWESTKHVFVEDVAPGLELAVVETGQIIEDVAEDTGDLVEYIGNGIVDGIVDYGENVADEWEDVAECKGWRDCAKESGEALGSLIGISDRRLKRDVKKTKVKSPIPGLNVYTWKWNEIAASTYGIRGKEFGFITDEIDDKYIGKDAYGYEYIRKNTPILEGLKILKSKYRVRT
jgi:hypothetical protein